MNRLLVVASLVALLVAAQGHASLLDRLLTRRDSGDVERESTTPKSQQDGGIRANSANQMQPPARLYPDLPQPVGGQAGFHAPGQFGMSPFGSVNQPPTPFVPFGGPQMPNRFTDPRFQPRPMSSAERVQSQTFTNGLGRRLLSMIGIQMPEPNGSNETLATRSDNQEAGVQMSPQDSMRAALQNSTVLSQLSRGVQSIYGNLSKMYGETVHQQLQLLQERFKQEGGNSTNMWQQRMSQQIPQFFKNLAMRVESAQENLNRLVRDVTNAHNGTMNWTLPNGVAGPNGQPGGFFSSIDRFLNDGGGQLFQPNNFFNGFAGFGGDQNGPTERQDPPQGGEGPTGGQQQQQQPRPNLMQQLSYYWHQQVQPQIGMLRGQVAQTWRDLTASGVLPPASSSRSRPSQGSGNGNGDTQATSSSELVDNILKSVDLGGPEYSLVEPAGDERKEQPAQQQPPMAPNLLSTQMQNGLVNMQRELNQLWAGLSRTLQNAVSNARQMLNPRPQFGAPNPLDTAASTRSEEDKKNEVEIEDKIKELNKLQRDTDAVYSVVQQQQQQNAQQRPNFTDRFRNFFGNMDLNGLDQLPGRVSDQVNRFGTVVTDLWNQIPERWDNFMQAGRQMVPPPQMQPDMTNARFTASSATSTTSKPRK